MSGIKDIPIGTQFGKWTVRGLAFTDRWAFWNVTCVCGEKRAVLGSRLRSGKSLGCQSCVQITHGMAHSATYNIWKKMAQRCTWPGDIGWKNYGGRGITVCKRWLKFENFFKDMGERPEGLTLDREKNWLGYSKANCRWVTRKTNQRNTRGNCFVLYQEINMTLVEASELSGISYSVLQSRLQSKNPDIFRPVRKYG